MDALKQYKKSAIMAESLSPHGAFLSASIHAGYFLYGPHVLEGFMGAKILGVII